MKPQGEKERRRSIKSSLVMLLLFVLLPVIAVQAYIFYESYRQQRTSALQDNLEIARALSKAFDFFVQDVTHQELAIGIAITSSQPMTPEDITRLLETSRDYDAVRDFTWMNTQGDAIYSGNPSVVGRNYSDRSYFREILNGREWAVSELLISKATGQPVFGISRGIRDDKGVLLGIVVAMILPDKLAHRLGVERSQGGALSLVDRKGMLVFRHPDINPTWEERNWLKQYPEYEEAFKGREIAKTIYASYEGKDRLVGIVPISSLGWAAAAGKREEDVTGPIYSSLVQSALLFLSISLAAFFIALAISRRITNPIMELHTHALALADGKEPAPVQVEDASEFRDLAEAFNAMAEKVQAREMALRQTEKRLRMAQKYGEVGVWGWDVQTDQLVLEPELEELYGVPPGTIRTREDWNRHIHPEDVARIKAEREAGLAGPMPFTPFQIEFRIRHADGSERWMLARGSGEYNDSGRLQRVLGVNVDITESKRMEEALRKATEELEERVKERTYELYAESLYARSLIEASLDPLVTISPEGQITDVNHATEEVTGLPREQLIGSDFSDYFTAPEKARAGYEEVFRRGFVRDYPLDLKHRDGHATPVLYNATVYRDDAGQIKGVFAAARDMSDIKKAEGATRTERKRFFSVLETLPVYVILLTPDYHVPFANRFFRERFGESQGRPCYEYLFNRAEPCETCESYTVFKTGKPHHWEWTGPDGRNYDIFDFPFTDTDGSLLIMEMGIDVTEVKRAQEALRAANEMLELRVVERTAKLAESEEQLRQSNERLEQRVRERTKDLQNLTVELEKSRNSLRHLASELVLAEERERKRVATVLHDEIAQTLAVARMRVDMLNSLASDDESRKTVKEAKDFLVQSIQETRALMNDLGNPLLFDMGVAAACESLADRLMASHPIQIRCDVRESFKNLDPEVKVILFQVVRELLNNVIKHSGARNAEVLIHMDDGQIQATVKDDGMGFDPRTIGAPTAEGGFGLFSIRERLVAFKGTISIESTPETGTVITASLPSRLERTLKDGRDTSE